MSAFTLELTPAHHELVKRAHAFAEDVIRPAAAHYDHLQECPWDVVDQAAQAGFYNALFYSDLISDPTGLSLPLFLEEIFWGCAGIGLTVVLPALALSALNQAGTPEQLARWAPEMFGEPGDIKLAALAVSEPQGGSDVANLQTRARKEGDEWVLDGTKIGIGNGRIADVTIVNAVVDPELGTKGQATFVVATDTPGTTEVRRLEKLGHRASHTAELAFENCRIPADQLLGGEDKLNHKLAKARRGEGSSAALGTLEQTRPMVAAMALGVARAAFEYACEYASEREAFGGPIIENQGVAFPSPTSPTSPTSPPTSTPPACSAGVPRGWPPPACRSPWARARCRSSRPPRSRCAPPSRPCRPAAAGATSPISSWRSGTATRSSTRSSRAPAKSSGWSSTGRCARPGARSTTSCPAPRRAACASASATGRSPASAPAKCS